ncbi:MAG TPA: hypothetical protein VJA66_07835, partial [Thermoanaerobaculia bacterium]
PVVARNLGALTEIVEDSGGGLLFERDEDLPGALSRLAADPTLGAELGRRGRAAAEQSWQEKSHVDAYERHVEKLLAEKKRA